MTLSLDQINKPRVDFLSPNIRFLLFTCKGRHVRKSLRSKRSNSHNQSFTSFNNFITVYFVKRENYYDYSLNLEQGGKYLSGISPIALFRDLSAILKRILHISLLQIDIGSKVRMWTVWPRGGKVGDNDKQH